MCPSVTNHPGQIVLPQTAMLLHALVFSLLIQQSRTKTDAVGRCLRFRENFRNHVQRAEEQAISAPLGGGAVCCLKLR
jgi:hypothetical protein